MKLTKSFLVHIATLGPLGYGTMPGTIGALATIPFVYFLHAAQLEVAQEVLVVVVVSALSYLVLQQVVPLFTIQDPPQIILDEVVGMLVTFCAIPFSWHTIALGFMLFRFFDIAKPLGIKACENWGGAAGVLCDDIAAGLLSNIALRIALFYIL